jgi:phosphatidate cytidylyltransferase
MPTARRPPSRSAARGQTRGAQQPRRSRQRGRGAQPARDGSDLLARILVAVPAAILAIVFIDIGGLAFALFMIAIGWLCLYELYRALERWRPLPLIAFASLAGMVLAARYGTHRDVMEVAVATLPVLFLFSLGRSGHGRLTVTIAGTLLGVFWIGFAFAHAVLLRQLPHGGAVIIDVLIGTFLGDTAAYAGGRLFGRTPLAPEISPNKTLEGLFCGMLIAVVSVFLAGLDSRAWLTQGDALLLGVAVAVLGPLGDLFESAIKRDAGIKDAGSVFGAHGGALDRLDAVIFTIVAGYYIWVAVMH